MPMARRVTGATTTYLYTTELFRTDRIVETKRRLAGLGAGVLADALVELAVVDMQAADLVGRLVTDRKGNGTRVAQKLAKLRQLDKYYKWDELKQMSCQLDALLEDIKAAACDPLDGIELVAQFFECDETVFENCDDDGYLGMVFDGAAIDLFASYASKCADKNRVVSTLMRLCGEDNYGVRSSLIDKASKFFNRSELNDLLQAVRAESHTCSGKVPYNPWERYANSIEKQIAVLKS
jgi:hypothetical protein